MGAALLAEQSLREIREQLQQREQSAAVLSDQVADLSREVLQVRAQYEQSERDNLTLSSELLSVQTEYENNSADLTQLTAQHQALESENADLRAQLKDVQEANLTYSDDLTNMTERLSVFSEEKAQLELFLQGQVDAAVEEIEQMRQVTSTQQELFDLTQKQLTEAIQERKSSVAQLQEARAQVQALLR